MERRSGSTRAGVLMWTRTPGYSSPPRIQGSGFPCIDGGDEDFQSLMDENGIIGLREGLEEMDREDRVLGGEEGSFGTSELEESHHPMQEHLSTHLCDLLDSEPLSLESGEDCLSDSHSDGDPFNVSGDAVNGKNTKQKSHESADTFTARRGAISDRDMETNELETDMENGDQEQNSFPLQRAADSKQTWLESSGSDNSPSQSPVHCPKHSATVEGHKPTGCVQHVSVTLSSSPGSSPGSTPPYGRHRGQRNSKISAINQKDVWRKQMIHPLPDFSNVEPRVRPKSNYRPPKSRTLHNMRDSKPESSLMFKSHAYAVREVLSSSTDGLSETLAPSGSQKTLNSNVPESSTLLQQLQDDYNRLLIKYAEAENTIDRLRLEAKVNLYSELPMPSLPVLSGAIQEGSKVMALNFPQAQRADVSTNTLQSSPQAVSSKATGGTPTLPSSIVSRCHDSLTQLTEALTKQTRRFQVQVDGFEELLKSGKLKPHKQTQGLSWLTQGQESLERAYMAAVKQCQDLQKQTGGEISPFDPDRDLEGLIFNSGMKLKELKDELELSEQNWVMSEPASSTPVDISTPCESLKETEPLPESPVSAVHMEHRVEVEMGSASGESDQDMKHEEESLPSLLRPLHYKHQRVEKDFSNLMDHYQKIKDLPKVLDRGLTEEFHNSLNRRGSSPPPRPPYTARKIEMADGQLGSCRMGSRTPNQQDLSRLVQPLPMAESLSIPSTSSPVCHSMETLPEARLPASPLPRQHDSLSNAKSSKQSLSSTGESTNLEKRSVKENGRAPPRAPHQDGVISPEMDSGFVGSESSQQTLAAHSPVQQRAAVRAARPSVTPQSCRIKADASSLGVQPVLHSPAHTRLSSVDSENFASRSRRIPGCRGEAGRRLSLDPVMSCSPPRWSKTHLKPWPSSELDSACSLSGEEVQQGKRYTKLTNPGACSLRSPSPAVSYLHSDHLKAQSEALQDLQAEVIKLKERLEGNLRRSTPSSPMRAPPSALDDFGDSTTPHTATPQQRNSRSLDRREAGKTGARGSLRNGGEERERRNETRPVTSRRSASLPRFRPETQSSTDSEHAHSDPKPWVSEHVPSNSAGKRPNRQARAEPGRRTGPHTDTNSSQRETRSVSSVHLQSGSLYLGPALPPPVLGVMPVIQYVPVCPPVISYYSTPAASPSSPKPASFSRNENKGHRLGGKDHHRRSLSADMQRMLDCATSATRSIRNVLHNRSSVRTLTPEVRHRSPLAQSCTY